MKLRNLARMYGEKAAFVEYMKDCAKAWMERIKRKAIAYADAIKDAWSQHISMSLRHEETIDQAWGRRCAYDAR